jgi:hypothetical protein
VRLGHVISGKVMLVPVDTLKLRQLKSCLALEVQVKTCEVRLGVVMSGNDRLYHIVSG